MLKKRQTPARASRVPGVPTAPLTARVDPREYPYEYEARFLGSTTAKDFIAAALQIGAGGAGYRRRGRKVFFRTAQDLRDLHSPESPDRIVRLAVTHDAVINPVMGPRAPRKRRTSQRGVATTGAVLGVAGAAVGVVSGMALNKKYPDGVTIGPVAGVRPSVPLAAAGFGLALVARRMRWEQTKRAAVGLGVGATIASLVPTKA